MDDAVAIQASGTSVHINDAAGTSSYRNHLPPDDEVHVIGVYETLSRGFQEHPTGAPQVNVEYDSLEPMKPVTLVLSSYEPNNWHFNIDPGAQVKKIVLNGYHEQSVTGTGDIPIMNFSGRASGQSWLGSCAYSWPLSTGGCDTSEVLVALEELFGTRVSSFTGAYRAADFTVNGAAASSRAVNPRFGAGNLSDGANPDLIYDARTGEVQIDLRDLAANYPFGSGEIWWQHFDAQRLYIALANHDGSFDVDGFDATALQNIGFNARTPSINENRLGYDGTSMRDWNGELISLGQLFPTGMRNPASLREYLAAATFSTNQESGEFDLIVVVPEPSPSFILGALLFIGAAGRRQRHR